MVARRLAELFFKEWSLCWIMSLSASSPSTAATGTSPLTPRLACDEDPDGSERRRRVGSPDGRTSEKHKQLP